MAQSEPCIRYALLAIGNLCESTTGSMRDIRSSSGTTSRQHIPLGHYNKAVDLLVKRMSEPSYTNEIGLVACILFICIEFLRGEHFTALVHFTNGLKMIAASERARSPSSNGSAEHSMVEDTLAPMFVRMMAIPIMNGIPTQLVVDYPPTLRSTPFTSIREAQIEMHKIRNKTMQFTNDMLASIPAEGIIPDFEYETQSYVLNAHESWLAAFEAFEHKATLSREELITAHSLKASYHCTFVFALCAPSGTQTSFDMHLDIFKAVLHHAEMYLDMKSSTTSSLPGANFTFDIEILPFICFTAQYCREPITRRHAISLLERKSPREGLYDSEPNIPVMKRLVEIEEEQVDPMTGWPVERTRIWINVINGDMDEHGRFSAIFARGFWGDGKGLPKIEDGVVLSRDNGDRLWKEWFVI